MTVSSTTVRSQHIGTGANTELATGFEFNESSEVKVTSRVTATGVETVLDETTHYTVAGGSWANGTVTPVDGATDFPSTVTWTLERVTPLTQSTNWVENDDFPAASHEAAADKLTYAAQERSDKAARSLVIPSTDPTTLDMELPNSVDRASLFLAFDADGEPVAAAGVTPATVTVSSFGADLIGVADADAARVELDAQEAVITAQGDLIVGDATPEASVLPIGANGTVLQSDGTDPSWVTPASVDTGLPPGYLHGLVLTHTSTTQLSVAKGKCRCGSSADQDLVNGVNPSAFSKTFVTGGFVAGTGNSGVPTAAGFAAAADDWHYFMLVKQDGSAIEFGYDTDIDAANLIADAAVISVVGADCYYRRIFTFRSSATPDIPAFVQRPGDRFMLVVASEAYKDTSEDFVPGKTITLATMPGGVDMVGLLRVVLDLCSPGAGIVIQPMYETIDDPDINDPPLGTIFSAVNGEPHAQELEIDIDSARQVQVSALTDDDISLAISTRGWIDRRGRDD